MLIKRNLIKLMLKLEMMKKNLNQILMIQQMINNLRMLQRHKKKNLAQLCLIKMTIIFPIRKNLIKINLLLKDLGFICSQGLNFS